MIIILEEYRKEREAAGTWPPSDDFYEYWSGRRNKREVPAIIPKEPRPPNPPLKHG